MRTRSVSSTVHFLKEEDNFETLLISDMTSKTTLSIYKNLMRELTTTKGLFSYRSSPMYWKINDEYRRHRPMAAKHCKETNEMTFLAQTYLTYLESARHRHRIHSTYSKGEKSVQQAANIVGLELPKTIDREPIPLNQLSD
jgi:hypothetical protein